MMNLFDKTMDRTVNFTSYIGQFALAAVMLIITANVFYRIFGKIIPGTYDLIETIVVLVSAFSLPLCELAKKHTNVDMLITLMKDKPRIWLEQFCNLISFVYWITIAWATIRVTFEKAAVGEATDLLKVSIIPFRFIWSFGLVLMAAIVLYNIYRNFRELRRIEP
jgi:TRAP-type C4-dicarboxylate transport system permease small subunit